MDSLLFTSESVSEGHPDKVCDQISDAILDCCLAQDPLSRVACETLVKNNLVILAGEITSQAKINYDQLVRQVIADIGYLDPAVGFDAESCKIQVEITQQSNDISIGVTPEHNKDHEQGAGDQGLMFGFACDQTDDLMPLPISLAQSLMKTLAKKRKEGAADFLRPDSKSQVTVVYQDGRPASVDTVVISTQHSTECSMSTVSEFVIEEVIKKVIPQQYLTQKTRFLINPTGRFVVGGPVGDCGLTGRKIIVDTYGGYSRHGGGAFSGKDPSKVDRSAAYAARYIAKNIVASGLASKCEVQLAYAIGVAKPVSIYVDSFGTSKISDAKISGILPEIFPTTPQQIIEGLSLLKPIYRETAAYGHFGRQPTENGHFSWEKLDKKDSLKKAI